MSQYNAQADSAAEYAGWEAFAPGLAPFHPTMDQPEGWSTPAHAGARQMVGNKAALPPNVGSMSLHAKAGSTGAALQPICASCSAPFPNNHQLEQHAAKNKHKAYLCTCGKALTKLSALKRHIEESAQARAHQCPLCDKEFKRSGHVEQHLRLIHRKSKDAIKDLLSARKAQPRQDSDQASAASAVIPAGPTNAQVNQPVVIPGGARTGPTDISAAVPAQYPGSRPGDFASLFSGLPTSGSGLVPEIPAFTPQSFMPQALDQAYPAYQTTAAANHTGLPANTAPDFVGYPSAYPAGDLGLFNVDPNTMPQNSVDAFGLPELENIFMGESFDFNFDLNFDNP